MKFIGSLPMVCDHKGPYTGGIQYVLFQWSVLLEALS